MKQDPNLTERARALRRNLSPTESILWKELRGRRFAGFKFRRQRPVGIYYADFLCVDCMLVIEADGESHLERSEEDKQRDAYFEKVGLKVLRFWNTLVFDELDAVLPWCLMNWMPCWSPFTRNVWRGRGAVNRSQGNGGRFDVRTPPHP